MQLGGWLFFTTNWGTFGWTELGLTHLGTGLQRVWWARKETGVRAY